jgi:RNA polymerase sigma-70 factor, ECF subfamily
MMRTVFSGYDMKQASKLEELLARTAGREEKPFLALYDLLSPRVLGLIRQTLPDSEAARDVLVEVFARLWREAGRISAARASAEVWLVLQARARAADRARKARGQRARAVARLDSLPASALWLPAGKASSLLDEKRNLLGKFLRQLPPSQARLLELAIIQGQTESEIAGQIGEPVGKVQTDLRAAFRFLRHRMQTVIGAWTAAI